MKNLARSIYLYRATFPDSTLSFMEKVDDGSSCAHNTIKELAQSMQWLVKTLHNKRYEVNINFTPLHDLECPIGVAPQLCSALTPAERTEFWRYFRQEEA